MTGGAQGLGLVLGQRLAAEGCDLVVADVNLDGAREAVRTIRDQHRRRAIAVKADVTSELEVESLFQQALAEFGRVDIVVSNAGPQAANGAVLRDPAPTGMTCSAVSCAGATSGAVCPAVSVAALQSPAGVTINTLPSGSSLTFTLTCAIP